ncbi:MAG: stage II sporulation protein R [Firmicutes bacterium]|nr:stage II sporulation protein R [Bacillota bacterium]
MKSLIAIAVFICALLGMVNGLSLHSAAQNSAFVGPDASVIPADALRLRIIANSNSPADQALKRAIRNRVIAFVGERVDRDRTVAQARRTLRAIVPQVEEIARGMVRAAHVPYGVTTMFGPTPFPTKLYGDKVYPAGVYQALRITLGKGAGQNWWCVLFPPLCFVALSDGDAIAATGAFPDYPPLAVVHLKEPDGKVIPVQLRLATVEYGVEFWKMISSEAAALWKDVVALR